MYSSYVCNVQVNAIENLLFFFDKCIYHLDILSEDINDDIIFKAHMFKLYLSLYGILSSLQSENIISINIKQIFRYIIDLLNTNNRNYMNDVKKLLLTLREGFVLYRNQFIADTASVTSIYHEDIVLNTLA